MHLPNPIRRHYSFSSSSSISTSTSSRYPAQLPADGYYDADHEVDDRFESPNPEQISTERRRELTRAALHLLSLCFIAVVVAVMFRSGVLSSDVPSDDYNANMASADDSNALLYYQAKVQAVCAVTDFRTTCVDTLSGDDGVHPKVSAGPKALLLLSLGAASRDVNRTRAYAAGVDASSLKPRTRVGFADCGELLDLAAGALHASAAYLSSAGFNDFLLKTVAGIRDAMSAAVAFEETCIDGLAGVPEEDEAGQLLAVLRNASENTRNSLAIVSSITSPLELAYDLTPLAPAPAPSPMQSPHAGKGKRMLAVRRLFSTRGDVTGPDAVVAKDGTGDFATISGALTQFNKTNERRRRDGRFVIYVKEGIYDEIVRVTFSMHNLTVYGDGPDKTIVTGNRSYANGYSLFGSATFAVSGFGFVAKGITFRNTAGPTKGPATALRVESDLAAFYNCHVEGHRNALHAHAHRQFYRECVVSGSADAISGDAAAVFQNCEVVVAEPAGPGGPPSAVVAQARVDRHETTGFVLQNCSITGGSAGGGGAWAAIGRPAKEQSRVVVVQSYLGDAVTAEGWDQVGDSGNSSAAYFGEYGNRGPGAAVGGRARWKAVHLMKEAEEVDMFTTGEFVQGGWWLNATGVPFYKGVLGVSS